MSGAGLQVNRNRGDDRFYNPAKGRKNHKTPENRASETSNPEPLPGSKQIESPLSNVERFLEAITPSVQAMFLSKTTMRGWRTCDVEFQPYFILSDLWDSFREWSAYGAGVPLLLNGSDSVVQYYVPYLSAIQLYVNPSKSPDKSRSVSEDCNGDYFSGDSSSDGSSDSERERGSAYKQRNHYIDPHDISRKMDRLFLREYRIGLQEEFSSDEGESGIPQGQLLFEYLERELPFCRESLADKISDLAVRCPQLMSARSCDLLSTSWFSVAWYPIYRIPTGPTLRDLDACFLTYHSLHTPEDDPASQAAFMIYPEDIDGIPRISLPVFGLASYKFRGSLGTSSSGTDRQLVDSLSQAADNWLRLLQVNHPDYQFFNRSR